MKSKPGLIRQLCCIPALAFALQATVVHAEMLGADKALESPAPTETDQATPTPTLGDNFTQVLPDRRVTFRLLAPQANDVKVLIGVKSGVYEPQGPRPPR